MALAQVEIDEYRDYEKAGGALREALKYMAKVGSPGSFGVVCVCFVCFVCFVWSVGGSC